MPTLQQRLKQPTTWLLIVAAVLCVVAADVLRAPEAQITARIYIKAVRFYQNHGRQLLQDKVRCRYTPTCSEYSVAAVTRHGLVPGLLLTARRVTSCTRAVPMGTYDPIPQ